jgi:signal transduction histidine kinase/DNA-binding NarL/FixJ family response regulator/HPt (histidine-containing phosphotransfer) domain-containing protein
MQRSLSVLSLLGAPFVRLHHVTLGALARWWSQHVGGAVAGFTSRLSSRTLLAGGLSSIVVCALLVADLAGLVPDRVQAQREARVAMAEAVGLTSAMLTARGDAESLQRYLATVVGRSQSSSSNALAGIRLRSADGSFMVQAGTVDTDPQLLAQDTTSTDTRVVIAVLGAEDTWGHAELQFAPLSALAAFAPWLPPVAPLALCLAALCTFAFHLYLKRMLRHLDPSNAIPARVRTAFDTLAEGLLVLDPKGHIVLANKAFAAVLGVEADALIGRVAADLPWQQRAPSEGATAEPLPWLGAQADGQLRYGTPLTLPAMPAEGAGATVGATGIAQRRSFMVNSSPIPGGGKSPAGVLVSFDDVTELEAKELELRQARDAAQDANRAKSDFLANMSHEIRTPMNAILGFTDLMRRGQGKSAAEAAKYLNIIHGSGKHLLGLINDILDLSKVEAGHLDVERVPCAVHTVVLDVARIMAVKAEEKGIALRVNFTSALPAEVQTDPGRLRQVFTNLVGNAIKFTAQGEVRIDLHMAMQAGQEPLLCVDIADSGIGIAANRLESIFEPFVQAEASTTRQFGGTGLGLTISRRFARALGGDVRASSQPGRGSVFHVSINTGLDADALQAAPWLTAQQLQALQQQADEAQSSGVPATRWQFPPATVLVVDDGSENRELVRLVLQEVGLQVIEAENGAVALQQVAHHQPALVLMDIQMPVMDGNTATRTLRERGTTLPVLALTANAMKGFEHDIAQNGFTGHLTKPIDIDAMLATLARYLGGVQVAAAATPRSAEAGLEVPPTAPAQVAESAITSRLAQHPRLARVAANFCQQLPSKLADMQALLQAANFSELAAQAHWLKGAGGSVGYDAYFGPAKALEAAARSGDATASGAVMAQLHSMAQRTVAPAAFAAAPSAVNAATYPNSSAHPGQALGIKASASEPISPAAPLGAEVV